MENRLLVHSIEKKNLNGTLTLDEEFQFIVVKLKQNLLIVLAFCALEHFLCFTVEQHFFLMGLKQKMQSNFTAAQTGVSLE